MDKIKLVEAFTNKLVDPLVYDLTKVLEITAYNSGVSNHGVNFVGMLNVLAGIESISQFISEDSFQKIDNVKVVCKAIEKSKVKVKDLKLETLLKKEFNMTTDNKRQNSINEIIDKQVLNSDSELIDFISIRFENSAKEFMKKYMEIDKCVCADLVKVSPEFKQPLSELIWKFRNSHAHSFYPESEISDNIRGAVAWLYKNPHIKEGISMLEIEQNFELYQYKLVKIQKDDKDTNVVWLGVCPQVLFVYFKKGITNFLNAIEQDENVFKTFQRNFQNLSKKYDFEN